MKIIDFENERAKKLAVKDLKERGYKDPRILSNEEVIELVSISRKVVDAINRLKDGVCSIEETITKLSEIKNELITLAEDRKNGFLSDDYLWAVEKIEGYISEISELR